MSRIGKLEIKIPEGVSVELVSTGVKNSPPIVDVTGPLGNMKLQIGNLINIVSEDGTLKLAPFRDSKESRAQWGLYRTLVNNMVVGVHKGYSKELEIVGIGYRAEMKGRDLVMSLGYSHKITFTPPEGITISVTDQTNIKVEGYDKQKVGEVAAKIRAFRKPEPYKGKGVRYKGEKVKRKSTKSSK